MRVRKVYAIALACRSWGISPVEFERMRAERKITWQQVMTQVQVEIACSGFAAEALQQMVFPGIKALQRRQEQQKETDQAFEKLMAMKKAKRGKR